MNDFPKGGFFDEWFNEEEVEEQLKIWYTFADRLQDAFTPKLPTLKGNINKVWNW